MYDVLFMFEKNRHKIQIDMTKFKMRMILRCCMLWRNDIFDGAAGR